ncbi:MAG: type II secretion system F family protein [Acidimicrobiales bacterium]
MTALILAVSALWAFLITRSLLRVRLPEMSLRRRPVVPRMLTKRPAVVTAFVLCALLVGIRISLALVASWFLLRWWRRRVQAARRVRELESAMPEMVELLSVALYGGLGLQEACVAVSERIDGPLGDELQACMRQIQRGQRFDDALVDFRDRAGAAYRGVVSAILATQRYGLPLAATLERLSSEARAERRRLADARARRLPVQMLFPLVLLFLPSVLLVVVVPVIGAALLQLVSVA